MTHPFQEPRDDAKLKNLPPEELEFLWSLRYKEDGKIKNKLSKVQVEVPVRYGFTISLGQLSQFYVWLKARREWQQSVDLSNQAKEEFLKENPDATPEELLRVGQLHFTALSMRNGDSKAFVSIMKAITARDRVKTDREKADRANQTKVEAGLEALFVEIKGNKAAEAAFAKLKEALSKA